MALAVLIFSEGFGLVDMKYEIEWHSKKKGIGGCIKKYVGTEENKGVAWLSLSMIGLK